MADGQWSVVSGQWPVASGQWPVASGQWPVFFTQCLGRRCVGDWSVASFFYSVFRSAGGPEFRLPIQLLPG
jgi:hypothetical protein